jgi:hypothetical protein
MMIWVTVTDTARSMLCPPAPVIVKAQVPTATGLTLKVPLPPAGVIVAMPLQFVLDAVNDVLPVCDAVTICAALGIARKETDDGFSVRALGDGAVVGVAVGGAVGADVGDAVGGAVGVVVAALAGATRIP